jgi:CRP/FNR family transcriptional regulator
MGQARSGTIPANLRSPAAGFLRPDRPWGYAHGGGRTPLVIPSPSSQPAPICSKVCLSCEVRQQAICSALEEGELGALEQIMTETRLAANQVLVREGDPRLRVYTLTSGMLRLSTLLPDGRRQITAFLVPGDYLGLADDDTYAQSAEAVVASQLCGFGIAAMDDLMLRFPRLKDRLHAMTRTALRRARESQVLLGRLTPLEKLAFLLLVTAGRAAAMGRSSDTVYLPMSRTDIADHLGLTIETVSRSFTKLRVARLIALPDPQHVRILDTKGLEAAAGGAPRMETRRSS